MDRGYSCTTFTECRKQANFLPSPISPPISPSRPSRSRRRMHSTLFLPRDLLRNGKVELLRVVKSLPSVNRTPTTRRSNRTSRMTSFQPRPALTLPAPARFKVSQVTLIVKSLRVESGFPHRIYRSKKRAHLAKRLSSVPKAWR